MRVLVFEYVSGGGYARHEVSAEILCEGFAMLRSIISDFKAAGHHITTFIDSRLASFSPLINADVTLQVSRGINLIGKLVEAAKKTDAALIIAPETEQILKSLVETIEKETFSLNCQAHAISVVSNKVKVYNELKRRGLPISEFGLVKANRLNDALKVANELGFPLILKPVTGVGCSGLSMIKTPSQLKKAIKVFGHERGAVSLVIIQKFVAGIAASVSSLSSEKEVLPLTLNLQILRLSATGSTYQGGVVPLDHPIKREAFEVAKRCVEAFEGLRGYVGVDLVLSKDRPVVMEINPRLTTSYIGMRNVVSMNPAEAIVQAVAFGKLPSRVKINGYSYFSKVKFSKFNLKCLKNKAYNVREMVAPPFPLTEDQAYGLIVTYASTLDAARKRFREIKKQLVG